MQESTTPQKLHFPSARLVHRSGIVESHARYSSTAQKSQNPTRRNRLPLRNRRISRAGTFHRSEIAESYAQEQSTAQESQNSTRRSRPPLRDRRIPRAGEVHRSGIAVLHA